MTREAAAAAFDAAVKRYDARCAAELKYTTWNRSTSEELALFAETIADAIVAAVAEERDRCLDKAREIAGSYPTDVFREISCMETQAVHEHYPGIVDRVSASMARFVIKRIVEEIEAEDEPPEKADG